MAGTYLGAVGWSLTRDAEGHREYKLRSKVLCETTDGPAIVLATPGLPQYGDVWQFFNDYDPWAWCRWDGSVTPFLQGEPNQHCIVEHTFSTKPNKRCQEVQIEDPLLQPATISGSFTRSVEEATHDRFGRAITNSAWEQFRGPQVEFDDSRPTVRIDQNLPSLNLPLLALYRDGVNAFSLWGLPQRTIKLSNVTWEKKFYGTCYTYYNRVLEFEINFAGWDRNLLDEGTKVLNGQWNQVTGEWTLLNINGQPPNRFDPTHFIKFKDKNGENARVILNGKGQPYVPATASGPQYWCLNDGISYSQCHFLTCAQAVDLAWTLDNVGITGPYTTNAECLTACVRTGNSAGTDPLEFLCSGGNDPGNIHVEKYNGVDFLLLGIPSSL